MSERVQSTDGRHAAPLGPAGLVLPPADLDRNGPHTPTVTQPNSLPGRRLRATTILGVKRAGEVALAGDGQVTLGDVVLKHGARKIRT